MRFRKIKCTKDGVVLEWDDISEEGNTPFHGSMDLGDEPAKELPESLQAFLPWAIELLGLPDEWKASTVVRQISISDGAENQGEGLIVTLSRPIKKAHDRPIVFNTPIMRGSEHGQSDIGTYGTEVEALIKDAEIAAAAYVSGTRGQRDLLEVEGESEQAPSDNGDKPKIVRPKKRKGAAQIAIIDEPGAASTGESPYEPDPLPPVPTDDEIQAMRAAAESGT